MTDKEWIACGERISDGSSDSGRHMAQLQFRFGPELFQRAAIWDEKCMRSKTFNPLESECCDYIPSEHFCGRTPLLLQFVDNYNYINYTIVETREYAEPQQMNLSVLL